LFKPGFLILLNNGDLCGLWLSCFVVDCQHLVLRSQELSNADQLHALSTELQTYLFDNLMVSFRLKDLKFNVALVFAVWILVRQHQGVAGLVNIFANVTTLHCMHSNDVTQS